ncbi:MAG: adenylosuccinate lyase [Acholeplasma sp.]|nr:adenylosuccinate lyase [Acholeplasma sp.]
MIDRYSRKQMKEIWGEQSRFEAFLEVEKKSSEAWFKKGLMKKDELNDILKATFDLEEIKQLELETKHDVIAFTRNLSNRMDSNAKKWIHYGLTSTDIVDTANGFIIKKANDILFKDITNFMEVLKTKAFEYKQTICVGRTHGVHADLTSFGLKYVLWYDEFKRHLERFNLARKQIEVGKISGAVGNYANVDPFIESDVCASLGLIKSDISTQVLQRDRHAFYITTLALMGSTLEKIAVEIRHLSRTEVMEVKEGFSKNQKGSSAMPHKKNPIASENISGCARLLRGYMMPAFENIPLWHERDISHSSVERVILEDATTLLDYMLVRFKEVVDHLFVDEAKMRENIQLTYGAIYAQRLMNTLIEQHKYTREAAYDFIQKVSLKAIESKTNIKTLLLDENEFFGIHPLTEQQIEASMTNEYYFKHVNQIYNKVFS